MVLVFLDFLSAIGFANVTEGAKDAKKKQREKVEDAKLAEHEHANLNLVLIQG